MATKPLTREEIANTEKKLDMPLDDIIKMYKNQTKPRKQQRALNKGQKAFHNVAQEKALKVRRYMNSRPFIRQGPLSQRRSNFQVNQFPLGSEVARKAAVSRFHGPFDRNVFANRDKARAGAFVGQRGSANGGNIVKLTQQKQQHGDGGVKQRPLTLDSRFANMKEERMKVLSRRNYAGQHKANGFRPRVPWARGRW